MRALAIDFAPRGPARVIASMRPVHWLLVVAGLALGAGGMIALHDLTQRQEARQAALVQVRAQADIRAAAAAGPRKTSISAARANAVNLAIQQLNLPWSNLLTAIERATPASVALLELAPDAKRHRVIGMAETKSSGAMFAYITRLKRQAFLGNVLLTKHEIDEQDENRPLRFEFAAEWPEAGP